MISIRHLEVFRAVMACRSMTGAAQALSVTQSAVSKIAKELQEQVGFPLFARSRGGLVPSPEALSLHAEVERSFIGLEKILRTAERIRLKRHGHLRIVAMPALSTVFIPGVVRAFGQRCPGVHVTLETYNSPEVVELMAGGQFDIGYAMTPIDGGQVAVGEAMRTQCVCVLPPGHRLRVKNRLGPRDLAGERFISLVDGNSTRLKTDALFRNENIPREMAAEASWSAAVCGLVAQGLGVAIVEPFTAQLAAKLGCEVRPLAQALEFSFAEILPRTVREHELAALFSQCFAEAYQAFNAGLASGPGLKRRSP
jgi:DNA-binding transcriptional LysR family regulator